MLAARHDDDDDDDNKLCNFSIINIVGNSLLIRAGFIF